MVLILFGALFWGISWKDAGYVAVCRLYERKSNAVDYILIDKYFVPFAHVDNIS